MSTPIPPSLQTLVGLLEPDRNRPGQADGVARTRSAVRVAWLGTIIAAGYVALSVKASALMLLPDPQLETKAKVQFEEVVEVRGRRGDVLDRNGAVLATTVELTALHADPDLLDPGSAHALAEVVAPYAGVSPSHLASRLAVEGRRDVLMARELTPTDTRRISEELRKVAIDHPSVRGATWKEGEPQRFYPGVDDAGPLLGLVNRNGTGMAGLERTWDRELRGEVHKYVIWRDRKGRRVTPDSAHANEGHTIVLTLDRRIQHVAEEAVSEALERTGAQDAHAMVVDVATGEILAMVNRPTINPNDTSQFDIKQFKNHAAMDAFEPGSVFKPFVAAAAMEEGLVNPTTLVDCEGGHWAIGHKVIHDDHPHGVVTLAEVIKYSSNIGAAKLAFKLGPDRAIRYLTDFGFGRATGLDLPGETRGVLRSADTIKPIELATTAYGHGVSTSAIQLASAVATLGNDGVRMQLRLVREVRDSHGEVIERFDPVRDRRVISVENARKVIEMMVAVTEQGGTGTRARVPGYEVAGKTGTAWKHVDGGYSATARIGSFVGVVPADHPRVAIAVVVDTPTIGSSYGGIVAAPAFAAIAAATMRVLGVPAHPALLDDDAISGAALADPRDAIPTAPPELTWTADGGLMAPDLTGLSLRDALVTLEGAGLRVQTTGSGQVARQVPAPGARLSPGDSVQVELH